MIRCPQQRSVWDADRHGVYHFIGCNGPLSAFPPGESPVGWVPIFDVFEDTEIVHHAPDGVLAKKRGVLEEVRRNVIPPAPALTVARIGHDQLCFPIAPLECALNGWIGLGPWAFGPDGTKRVVVRCRRVDGLYSARVQEAARA